MTAFHLGTMSRLLAVAAVAACLGGAAQAQQAGRDVMEKCDNGDPGDTLALIAGGMAYGMLTGQGLGGPERQFCPPNSGRLSNGQYRKAVCDFLRKNPKVQAQDGSLAIAISLLKSYPCPAP